MNTPLLLLMTALVVFACILPTNNPEGDPIENPDAPLAEADIGSSVGMIEAQGLILIVPPESFSSPVHIEIFSGVDSTHYKAPELTIKVTNIDFVYTGTLTEEDIIIGILKQMGQSLALNLTRIQEDE